MLPKSWSALIFHRTDDDDPSTRQGFEEVSPLNPLPVGSYDSSGQLLPGLSTQLVSQAYGRTLSTPRPEDTNAYAAADVVGASVGSSGAVWTFPNMGPAGGGRVSILDTQLEIDVTAVPTGMANFLMHMYSVSPPSALGDNGAWTLAAVDVPSYLGYIDLQSPALPSAGALALLSMRSGVNKVINLASSTLFCYIVTQGGYTPASAVVQRITLQSLAF